MTSAIAVYCQVFLQLSKKKFQCVTLKKVETQEYTSKSIQVIKKNVVKAGVGNIFWHSRPKIAW